MKKNIKIYRSEINIIDKSLIKLLSKREKIAKKIGKLKSIQKIDITDKKREKEIFKKTKSKFVKSVFIQIIKSSKKLQKRY